MTEKLKILHLEDNANDAELIHARIMDEGIDAEFTLVESRDGFVRALEREQFDLVISDYTIPSFGGKEALEMARKLQPEAEFIFVSGTIGEDRAVESLLMGATDYVLKDRLSRLVPAVKRALQEAMNTKARGRAERALRESEEKYRSLFEMNPAATFVSNPEGVVHHCNPQFLRMFGFRSYEQAIGTNVSRLYQDAKDRELVLASLEGGRVVENLKLHMKTMEGKPLQVIASVVGTYDANGRLVEKTGYLIDDTKRQQLEQELLQSQKLESLGTLAGGIAHDFNNILGIVMGYVSLLERRKGDGNNFEESLTAINNALRRGTGLVRQLMTFARRGELVLEPVQVNEIVKELLKLLGQAFPKIIEINTELGLHVPAILADATQVHQVFLNLCVNARDAMQSGGRLFIGTRVADGEVVRQQFATAAADKYVAVEVRDSGSGMDEATKRRLFEPFFTTKATGKGTGLGLAVVFGIVQTHKGYIGVESAPGAGTTFQVYFPVQTTGFVHAEQGTKAHRESLGGKETILLVDDEPQLVETTRIALTSKGYTVLNATDGYEALDMCKQNLAKIDLVLTDMDLPKLGGEELVRALMSLKPSIKIIVASGYLEPEAKARVLQSGAKTFLAKPYEHPTMLASVRQVLDSKC